MSVGERLRRELREIGLVTLYFFVCFAFFLSLKKLLLEQYHISLYVFNTAIIGALVTAKVVVILEKTSFGTRFQEGRLIVHVLWRTLLYTAAVLIVTLIEQLIDVYIDHGNLQQAIQDLWTDKEFDHYLALNLVIALSFLVYNTASELDRRLGHGAVRRLLFSRFLAQPAIPSGHPENGLSRPPGMRAGAINRDAASK